MSLAAASPEPNRRERAAAVSPSATPDQVLRPVQYLGNKQRSLSVILSAIDGLVCPGDAVADLFTGTSVVSQALSALNLQVTAVDVSPACAEMARATLGIGRRAEMHTEELVESWRLKSAIAENALATAFSSWIEVEREALADGDGRALIEVGRAVPQVWRPTDRSGSAEELFATWHEAARGEQQSPALLSPVFAGSYLGIGQAVEIDARRQALTEMATAGEIDGWEASAMVTALLAATSAAAFSPGKHFAQPHRTDDRKDLDFHYRRVVADRSVDIAATSEQWIELLDSRPQPVQDHEVLQVPVSEITTSALVDRGIRLVYADPPYTAQQYSRFYHVLDTLAEGRPRPLQVHRGRITSGLYPDGRYLSPYCSKRQAPPAFAQLASVCKAAEATLAFSYSASAASSTGNQRMISLDDLCRVLVHVYGPAAVEVTELGHDYRQFNRRDSARATRDDPEVLVVAHAA